MEGFVARASVDESQDEEKIPDRFLRKESRWEILQVRTWMVSESTLFASQEVG